MRAPSELRRKPIASVPVVGSRSTAAETSDSPVSSVLRETNEGE